MWYVYFLELSNKDIYVGFSSNLKYRVKAHNNADVPATSPLLSFLLNLKVTLLLIQKKELFL
jgi:hypothetical protein